MELQEFIESSISQIVSGIANAGKTAKENGASLNPRQDTWRYGEGIYFDAKTGSILTNIEFDIAVTATEGEKKKEGIGVAIASVVLGTQNQSEKGNEQVSRIKFSIPVVLPSSEIQTEEDT